MALVNEPSGGMKGPNLRKNYPATRNPNPGDHGKSLYTHPSTNRPSASLATDPNHSPSDPNFPSPPSPPSGPNPNYPPPPPAGPDPNFPNNPNYPSS